MITPKKNGGITLKLPANSHIEVLNWGGEAVLREPIDMREVLLRK